MLNSIILSSCGLRIAGLIKAYHIGSIQKLTATFKNILWSKVKDKLHTLNKSRAIYAIKCHKYDGLYIGRAAKDIL